MNSCILMAKIISSPKLRYTQDQKSVADMMVEFAGLGPEDPPANLKVTGWGNLAEEIGNSYQEGDRIIVEGRLAMNTIEINGRKEKRAELVASRIYPLTENSDWSNPLPAGDRTKTDTPTSTTETKTSVRQEIPMPSTPASAVADFEAETPAATTAASSDDSDTDSGWDEIPFVRSVYTKANWKNALCDPWELSSDRYWDGIKQ